MAEEQKQAENVVTSENLAEFNNHRMNIAAPPPAPKNEAESDKEKPVQDTEADPEADEASPDEAKDQPAKKPAPKIQQRFSELTRQRDEARAAEQRAIEQANEATARLEALKAPPDASAEPDPNHYGDPKAYAKAYADWTRAAERAEEAKAAAQAQHDELARGWEKRQNEFRKDTPDYEEVVAGASDILIADDVRQAIVESDAGPQIVYYLAGHPEEAHALVKRSLTAQIREIGRLEAKFAAPEAAPAAKADPASRISRAPPPMNPLKGGNGVAQVPIDDKGEFTGDYQTYKALRLKGKIS